MKTDSLKVAIESKLVIRTNDLIAENIRIKELLENFSDDVIRTTNMIKDCKYEPDKVLILCESMRRLVGVVEASYEKQEDPKCPMCHREVSSYYCPTCDIGFRRR